MGDLATILVLAFSAMLNPTLLAAVTLMMLLPETKRLMLGYLLGSYLTSISLGLLIVFSLHDSGSVETARNTLTPAEDIVLGTIALIVGLVLRSDRGERRRKQKEEEPKRESWPQRLLGRGSAKVAFAVGAVLSFPGASYLVALDRIAHLDAGAGAAAALVICFCLVQQVLLEAPLIGYAVSPEWTQRAVDRFSRWLREKGRQTAAAGAVVIGLLLLLRGLLELVL
ncbi:MAG: GAP family protein [Solirubrobacterales bacterium]